MTEFQRWIIAGALQLTIISTGWRIEGALDKVAASVDRQTVASLCIAAAMNGVWSDRCNELAGRQHD